MKTIRLEKLHTFENHPYKVQDDAAMEELRRSMAEAGLLNRIIVRPMEGKEDEYEIISGHRRVFAAKQLGMKELPAVVYTVDRDEATLMMVNSNCQRETLLPSEKAFAYKMKLDAIKHQGISCGQDGHKSRENISDTESGRTIQRYIRLTHLIPELLELTDKGRIALMVACELSYLPRNMQSYQFCVLVPLPDTLVFIGFLNVTPSGEAVPLETAEMMSIIIVDFPPPGSP